MLIHINEALSGLPVKVRFISPEDVKAGALRETDVLINAGQAGDAWSGGDAWKDPETEAEVTRFVNEGGALIGVGEPSAREGGYPGLPCPTCWAWTGIRENTPAICPGALRRSGRAPSGFIRRPSERRRASA